MEIVVHYPENKQGINALRKAVAETHSEYIYSYIERLQCSQEQKKMIIKGIDEMLTQRRVKDWRYHRLPVFCCCRAYDKNVQWAFLGKRGRFHFHKPLFDK